jgi:Cdc6-like AAA superfamily ATPase
MATFEHGDAPLRDPADDLLGMAPHARTLARFLENVKLPFTIGIYGKWGEGKTTYSNLLIKCLEKEPCWDKPGVIRFSAWPYITADAIWRALLDLIARELLLGQAENQDQSAEREQPTQQERPADLEQPEQATSANTFRQRMSRVLRTEVLTVRGGEVDADRQQYERFRKRFDRSAAVANRTLGEGSSGTTVTALAGLVLSAAATLAPGIVGLRKVLGIGDESVREMFAGEQPSAPEVVASVEELREDIKEIFKKGARPLIILLDDLDRCLPHVALDVLETVKVFFFESGDVNAKCLFIVAVDEELIGRGLRMRIGRDRQLDADAEARAYLEKIVQLRVPVPSPDDAHVRRLISASFPTWAWATDLCAAGIGRNPRRLKQQCNLMTYRFLAREQLRDDGDGES